MTKTKYDEARERARERAKKQAEDNKTGSGSSYLKLPDGIKLLKIDKDTLSANKTIVLDFLPFEITKSRTVPDTKKVDIELEKGDLWWYRSLFIHHNVGTDKKSILCPRTFKKPCPICEDRQALMDDDYDTNKKIIESLNAQHKDLFFVIDAAEKDGDVCVLEHSYANLRKHIEKELREQNVDEYYDHFQFEDGFSIKIRFEEGAYMKNKFYEADRVDFKKRLDYGEEILDDTFDFDNCLILLSYDQISKMHMGLDDDDDDDDDNEKEEPKRNRKSRKEEPEQRRERKSRKEEPEPEEEPEEEPEPKRNRKSRREEPEPEEEPRRGRKSRKEEPEPERKSKKRDRSREDDEEPRPPRPREDDEEPECPEGGKFGYDCDELEHCPDCPKGIWIKCADKQDELKKDDDIPF